MLPLINPLDAWLSTAIQSFSSAPLDYLMLGISLLGNPVFWIFVAALVYWKGKEKESFFLMNLLVLSTAVSSVLKPLIARERPYKFGMRSVKGFFSKYDAPMPFNYSFPSGHSTLIASIFFYCRKHSKLVDAALLTALLGVCLSRIYLGEHFFLDVAFGVLLGFLIAEFNLFLKDLLEVSRLKLTKSGDKFGLIATILVLLAALTTLSMPTLSVTIFGFYAGFFLFKEMNMDSRVTQGKEYAIKAVAGTIGLLAITLPAFLSLLPLYLEYTAFFLGGLWISLVFPAASERLSKTF